MTFLTLTSRPMNFWPVPPQKRTLTLWPRFILSRRGKCVAQKMWVVPVVLCVHGSKIKQRCVALINYVLSICCRNCQVMCELCWAKVIYFIMFYAIRSHIKLSSSQHTCFSLIYKIYYKKNNTLECTMYSLLYVTEII